MTKWRGFFASHCLSIFSFSKIISVSWSHLKIESSFHLQPLKILNNLIYTTGSKLGFRQVGCNIGGKGPNGAQISRIIGPFMSFLFGCNWELKAMIFFSVILRMGAAFPLSKFRRCRHTCRILSKCVSTQDNQYLKVGPCRSQNCVRSPEAIHLGSNFQTRCLSER